MKKTFTRIRRLSSNQVAVSWWCCLSMAFVICLNVSTLTYAQSKIWDKTIGGNRDDLLKSIQQTKDGGYILGGDSESDQSGDKTQGYKGETDYWIVKQNASGTKVWDKTFGGAKFEYLSVVLPTKDGGYLVGGSSSSGKGGDKSEPNKGGHDYWIIKLNANGSKAWDKTIGGGNHDFLSSVVVTPDGSFLLGGFSYSGISGDKSEANKDKNYPSWDYWIVKLRADGSKEWDKTIGGNGDDYLRSIQLTSDGGYIAGGSSNSGQNGDKTQASKGSEDYWIVKLNAYGNKVWDKTLGGQKGDELEVVQQTPDGSYLLGGTSDSGISGDKSENSKGTGTDPHKRKDYWLVKLKEDGTKVWDKTIGGNEYDGLTSLLQTKDGSYILGGSSESGISGDKSEANRGVIDFWVVKLNASGDQVWDKTIGGDAEEWLTEILPTNDGSYLVAGSSSSNKTGDKSHINKGFEYTKDYWLVKLTEKTAQTITFAPIAGKTYDDAPFTLSAKASSGLPVTFKVVSGPATIKGNTITLTGPGKVIVKASQAGNATFLPAEATQLFTVQTPMLAKIQWDKTIGGSGNDRLNNLIRTQDGGYLLSGSSSSGIGGDKTQAGTGSWLVKLKADGSKEWDKVIGKEYFVLQEQTSDGGYLLGSSSSDSDYQVVKLNSNGTVVWEKTFGGSKIDVFAVAHQTSDGGYIVGGYSESGISGDKTEASRGDRDYWIIKLKANGTKEWDKTFGGARIDLLTTVQQTSDGGYILGGQSVSYKSGDKSESLVGGEEEDTGDYWVVKVDSKGNKEWDNTIGGQGGDQFETLQQTQDGGYILAGTSSSGIGGDKTENKKGFFEDYWIVKLNPDGSKVWDKTIGGNEFDLVGDIRQTSDGGYIVGGSSSSGIGGDKTEANNGKPNVNGEPTYDYWVVKLDTNGNKLWDKTLGGEDNDGLYSVQETLDGGYVVAGSSRSNKSGDKSEDNKGVVQEIGSYDYWVIKLQDPKTPPATAWDMRYGGTGTDNLTDVIKTSDGGYLAGGYSASDNSGDKTQSSWGKNDYWIVKSDANGKKLWEKRYGGTADDYLNRVIQTQDGGYLLAGSSLSGISGNKTQGSRGDRDFWIVKIDAQGTKQWDKRFGGSGYDELKKVLQLPSGRYVLAGSSSSPAGGDKTQTSQGGSDFWLIKITNTGEKVWDHRYGGTLDETLGSFTQTADGGFLLAGSSLSGVSGDKSQASRGSSDYWVVKTDADGNLVWEKAYGGNSQDEAYSIARSGSDFLISGTSASGKSSDKSQVSQGGKDYWLVKIGATGTKLWDKTYGGSKDDELRASARLRNGNLVLGGTSFSAVSGTKTQGSRGNSDYWMVEVDEKGHQVQDKRFGGSGTEELRSIFQTADGGLLLGGRSDSNLSGEHSQTGRGGNDYWLVKVAPDNTPMVAAREAAPLEASLALTHSLNAYPNPLQEKATISFSLPETQQASVKVYDSQGNEVATLFNGEAKAKQVYEVEWKAADKPTGLYFLQLQTPTQKHQQKLLLAK